MSANMPPTMRPTCWACLSVRSAGWNHLLVLRVVDARDITLEGGLVDLLPMSRIGGSVALTTSERGSGLLPISFTAVGEHRIPGREEVLSAASRETYSTTGSLVVFSRSS